MSIQVDENRAVINTEGKLNSSIQKVSLSDVSDFENAMKIEENEIEQNKAINDNKSDINSDELVNEFITDLINTSPRNIIELRELLAGYNLQLKEKQDLMLTALSELREYSEVSDFVVSLIKKEVSLTIIKVGMINHMLTKTMKPDLE